MIKVLQNIMVYSLKQGNELSSKPFIEKGVIKNIYILLSFLKVLLCFFIVYF